VNLMSDQTSALPLHYSSRAERIADGWVHGVGLAIAAGGAGLLIALAAWRPGGREVGAVVVYSLCLLLMLAASAIYNLADRSRLRSTLRRADHAAIFVMIAGSYTPFTVGFEGAWAVGMTAAVWLIALAGAAGKLFLPGLSHRLWLGLYVALGWMVLVAIDPLVRSVSVLALVLLVVGGAIYTSGVAIYVLERLPFRRAIWHGFVLVAAGAHYAAILTGVVLT
jgi:hemolysin III